MDSDSIRRLEEPSLRGKTTDDRICAIFDVNGNRFELDMHVYNLKKVPKIELERVRNAVAAIKILKCPAGQYSSSSVLFDSPEEIYVLPESSRIRIYAYEWGQPISLKDMILLKGLVPRADDVQVCALPKFTSYGTIVTTLVLDIATEQEITRRNRENEQAAVLETLPVDSIPPEIAPSEPARSDDGATSRKRTWRFWE